MRASHKPVYTLFQDGSVGQLPVYRYEGACLIGDPTAYVYRNNQIVWVKPYSSELNEFIKWVEA